MYQMSHWVTSHSQASSNGLKTQRFLTYTIFTLTTGNGIK